MRSAILVVAALVLGAVLLLLGELAERLDRWAQRPRRPGRRRP